MSAEKQGGSVSMMQTRRRFLGSAAFAGAAGMLPLFGAQAAEPALGAEDLLETTTARLPRKAVVCVAPQYVAEALLRAEGFTEIRYIDQPPAATEPVASGKVDFDMNFASNLVKGIDAGEPIVLLSGVHVGCFELFAGNHVRTFADLRGKSVGIQVLGSTPHVLLSLLAAELGLDPARDIRWVTDPRVKPFDRFVAGKIDAFLGIAPEPQELRARHIGRELVNTAVDHPWSQYFCCLWGGNRQFVESHPVATKRVLRAILKAADLCAAQPARVARELVDRGFTSRYDYALTALRELPYDAWRHYDAEDTVRFYALRMREAGFIKSTPQQIIADGTNWRFLNELKRELKA
jgi:NitT/TauT family transport system substrate-binding protein